MTWQVPRAARALDGADSGPVGRSRSASPAALGLRPLTSGAPLGVFPLLTSILNHRMLKVIENRLQ